MLDLDKYKLDPATFASMASELLESAKLNVGNGDDSAAADASAYTGDEKKSAKKEKDSTAKDVTFKLLDTASKITTEVVKAGKPSAPKKKHKTKKKEDKSDKALQAIQAHEQEVSANLKKLASDAEEIANKAAASEHERAKSQEKAAEERKYVLGALAATALTVVGTAIYLVMKQAPAAAVAVAKKP